MNLEKLLEKRNTIYGICALWIICFHVYKRISMPYIPIITNIIGIGNMGVDIFVFLSGVCLSLSAKNHGDYESGGWLLYFKRRFSRIIPTYLIICIPYYLWNAAFEHSGNIAKKILIFFANISSATFWLYGTETTWYVFGIVFLYLLFPVIYLFFKKNGRTKKAIFLICMMVFAIATSYMPILKNSLLVWARIPIFTIGIMVGAEKTSIKDKHSTYVLALLLLIGSLILYRVLVDTFNIPTVFRFLYYIPMTLSLLVLISKYGNKNRAIEWVGRVSLEVYLIHITLLHPIKYYGIMDKVGYWLYLLLPCVTIVIAYFVSRIIRIIKY